MITLTEKGLVIHGETIYVDADIFDQGTLNGPFDFRLLGRISMVCRNKLIISESKPRKHEKYLRVAYGDMDANAITQDCRTLVWQNKFVLTKSTKLSSIDPLPDLSEDESNL